MRKGVISVAVAAFTAAPGLMFGSNSAAPPAANAVSAQTSALPAVPAPSVEVRVLGAKVQHALNSLAYYSVFDDLAFQINDTTVILAGQVMEPVVKSDAERAVRAIPGVRTVENQIEVLPLSRVDDQIRRAVYYAVYAYGPLERYDVGSQPAIRIIVKNGHVTLIGRVVNAMDRDLVYRRATTVPGVSSVTNRLAVEI